MRETSIKHKIFLKVMFTKAVPIVDRKKMLDNLQRMIKKARDSGVEFRPHFKTHQSPVIGDFFKNNGVEKISVSSVDMADYFSHFGWHDITICVPLNIHQIPRIDKLASKITLHILIENEVSASILVEKIKHPINVWIEIDTGYKRTGIEWNNTESIVKIAKMLSNHKNIQFQGILTHAGHSYHCSSHNEIKEIYEDTLQKMKFVKSELKKQGFEAIKISVGDTPTCSVIEKFDSEISEIRPGNFIFYDLKQLSISSCTFEQIALAVIAPVISVHPERSEFVVHCGAVHLSKDSMPDSENDGKPFFGKICKPNPDYTWGRPEKDVYIASVSQEHGIVKAPKSFIESLKIGDMLVVIPIHSCLVVNNFPYMYWTEGQPIKKMIYDQN